jgi:hypothetical protein
VISSISMSRFAARSWCVLVAHSCLSGVYVCRCLCASLCVNALFFSLLASLCVSACLHRARTAVAATATQALAGQSQSRLYLPAASHAARIHPQARPALCADRRHPRAPHDRILPWRRVVNDPIPHQCLFISPSLSHSPSLPVSASFDLSHSLSPGLCFFRSLSLSLSRSLLLSISLSPSPSPHRPILAERWPRECVSYTLRPVSRRISTPLSSTCRLAGMSIFSSDTRLRWHSRPLAAVLALIVTCTVLFSGVGRRPPPPQSDPSRLLSPLLRDWQPPPDFTMCASLPLARSLSLSLSLSPSPFLLPHVVVRADSSTTCRNKRLSRRPPTLPSTPPIWRCCVDSPRLCTRQRASVLGSDRGAHRLAAEIPPVPVRSSSRRCAHHTACPFPIAKRAVASHRCCLSGVDMLLAASLNVEVVVVGDRMCFGVRLSASPETFPIGTPRSVPTMRTCARTTSARRCLYSMLTPRPIHT